MYYNINTIQYVYYLAPKFQPSVAIPFLETEASLVGHSNSAAKFKQRYNAINTKPREQEANSVLKKNFIQKIYEIKTVQPIVFNTISKDGKDHNPIFKVSLRLNNPMKNEFLGTGMQLEISHSTRFFTFFENVISILPI
jgi:hypothetical protein